MTYRFVVNGGRSAGRKKRWRSPVSFIGLLLMGAAVIRELRLPPRKRTWHGLLWRRIPYDLRPPNPARIAHAVVGAQQSAPARSDRVRSRLDPQPGRALQPPARIARRTGKTGRRHGTDDRSSHRRYSPTRYHAWLDDR